MIFTSQTFYDYFSDKERDFDFLSSIEVMIADQVDVFLMQNWDHFLVSLSIAVILITIIYR